MDMCTYPPIAYRVHPRTHDLITALNNGVAPKLEDKPAYFMLYCAGSDHEETAFIDEETYNRTYEEMPGHVLVMSVRTID